MAKKSAEQEYRDAFERIITGCPIRIPVGSLPTLANIAREAGRDPSALKKSRYPAFVRDVEQHNEIVASLSGSRDRSLSAQLSGARQENRELCRDKEQLAIEKYKLQSDCLNLQGALLAAALELSEYKPKSNVLSFEAKSRSKFNSSPDS